MRGNRTFGGYFAENSLCVAHVSLCVAHVSLCVAHVSLCVAHISLLYRINITGVAQKKVICKANNLYINY